MALSSLFCTLINCKTEFALLWKTGIFGCFCWNLYFGLTCCFLRPRLFGASWRRWPDADPPWTWSRSSETEPVQGRNSRLPAYAAPSQNCIKVELFKLETKKIFFEFPFMKPEESPLRPDPQDPHVSQENTHSCPSRALDRQTRRVLGAEVWWTPRRDRLMARVATANRYFQHFRTFWRTGRKVYLLEPPATYTTKNLWVTVSF